MSEITSRVFDAYEDMARAQQILDGRHRSIRDGLTNARFAATNRVFIDACSRAKVDPTPRQASKYRNRRGAAYRAPRGSE